MKNTIRGIFICLILSSFLNVLFAEQSEPIETANIKEDIIAILINTVIESEFDQLVDSMEELSFQEKSDYKKEYRKIREHYRVAGPLQNTEREIDGVSKEKSVETAKIADAKNPVSGNDQTKLKSEKYKFQEWQFLYEEKCSKCHTLDRVFDQPKTEEQWRDCVTRMTAMSPLWITSEECSLIIDEITKTKEGAISKLPQKRHFADAQMLFMDRCTKCHQVGRILRNDKDKNEWEETVTRMRDNAPELFFEEDIPIIVDYLTKRGKIMREDHGSKMIVDRCLVCHEWGRILLERKSKRGWEDCVKNMRTLTRKELKKDWFTHDDFKIIVELLFKTQGDV